MNRKLLQIHGPFASEYSLAKVNRELAEQLMQMQTEYQIELVGDAASIDKLPDRSDFKKYPVLEELYNPKPLHADVAIYNNFPKNPTAEFGLANMKAKIKLAYLAWEETALPKRWVDEINHNLHGVLVTSDHVLDVFRSSGVTIPMKNVGQGIASDTQNLEKFKLNTNKKFKFLHISSGHYRKGVDILLEAYFKSFTADDDVVLVLKLSPNLDNEINKIIEQYNTDDAPEIEIINRGDLSDGQINYLYQQCDAVVLPSRAEGFGRPMAEAMRMRKPLITTAYSGQLDFCTQANCYLLNYDMKESKSSLGIPGAKLAEPDLEQLQHLLKQVKHDVESNEHELQHKLDRAYESANKLTWERTANLTLDFIQELENLAVLKTKKFALISTWNSICGIAEYSKKLYSKNLGLFNDFKVYANKDVGEWTAQDSEIVTRTWNYNEITFENTITELEKQKPDIIHIQHNHSFYQLANLQPILDYAKKNKVSIYLTLHSVQHIDSIDFKAISKFLNEFTTIFVHTIEDAEFLFEQSLENVKLIKHGIPHFPMQDKNRLRKKIGFKHNPTIATHGLIHSNKGFLELLTAMKLIKNQFPEIMCLFLTAVNSDNSTSAGVYKEMLQRVEELDLVNNVVIIPDFLEIEVVITMLQLADLTVLPYGQIYESSSGAVRTAIAAGNPVLITDSYIFNNLEVGIRVSNNDPHQLTESIIDLLENKELLEQEKSRIAAYAAANSWEQVSINYLQALVQ